MIQKPYVSIVTGTYNRLDSLKRMVQSVRSSIGLGIPYEIIIVDGGSTDGSLEWLRLQEDIVLVEQGELLGIVKAFDAGFKIAKGEYVVIGNDDIEFRYESLQNAVAFMNDHLDVGIGCFPQNRYSEDYTVAKIPAVQNGKSVSVYYGQVCIVPKWLGDKVGWWGDYENYGGDNEISCNVHELGLKVVPLESCCINDFKLNDALRTKNAQLGQNGKHPDSEKWVKKWTRNGKLGPNIIPAPTVRSPLHRIPRMVYAPLYEEDKFPMQLKTKHGLRDAFAERYLVSEINYRRNPESLYYAISMFMPDLVLIQCHDAKNLTYDMMMRYRDEFPTTKFVSWNGDYNPKVLNSPEYIQVMKLFDVATFVTAEVAIEYELKGINFRYWQIGYEDYIPQVLNQTQRDRYDVLFMGNCYNPIRTQMGQMLRYHKNWKTGLFGFWPSHLKADGNTQYDFAEGDALYRSSKIAIGDNLFPNSIGYVSNRLFQALHAGAFLLQQRIPNMEEFLGLQDGKHLVIWDDLEDLEYKISVYLPEEAERRKISEEGKRFVDKNHSFRNRVEELHRFLRELKNGEI